MRTLQLKREHREQQEEAGLIHPLGWERADTSCLDVALLTLLTQCTR